MVLVQPEVKNFVKDSPAAQKAAAKKAAAPAKAAKKDESSSGGVGFEAFRPLVLPLSLAGVAGGFAAAIKSDPEFARKLDETWSAKDSIGTGAGYETAPGLKDTPFYGGSNTSGAKPVRARARAWGGAGLHAPAAQSSAPARGATLRQAAGGRRLTVPRCTCPPSPAAGGCQEGHHQDCQEGGPSQEEVVLRLSRSARLSGPRLWRGSLVPRGAQPAPAPSAPTLYCAARPALPCARRPPEFSSRAAGAPRSRPQEKTIQMFISLCFSAT